MVCPRSGSATACREAKTDAISRLEHLKTASNRAEHCWYVTLGNATETKVRLRKSPMPCQTPEGVGRPERALSQSGLRLTRHCP